MTLTPKVAIVMPYYNEFELLKRTVDSILFQDYYNWKLFIVDDGSLKENRADHHIVQTRQIKIINKPNSGVSDARNRALDHIQAEGGFTHIAYCDADDIWNSMHLQKCLVSLDSLNTDLVYSVPDFKFTDGSQAVPYGIPIYKHYPGLEKLQEQNFIWISGVVHKIECLQPEGFDGTLNSLEDWDMWLRIAKAGFNIEHSLIDTPSFIYTIKPSGGNGSKCTDEIRKNLRKKHNI